MEESSEKRRDRLRAMRQEAMAVPASSPSMPMASSTSTSILGQPPLLPHPLPPHPESSPISRFDYYTDPLAAFSGSHKKKIRASAPPVSPPFRHDSPLWQPNFHPSPGCDPRSGFGSPQASYGHASPPPPHANQGYSNRNNDSQARNYGSNSASPGCDPRSGFGSPQPSPVPQMYRPGFGSPQPSSASPHPYSNASLSPHSFVTPPSQGNEGYSNRSNDFKTRNYGSSPGSRGSPWTGGFNRSPGGRGSPGVNRDARCPGTSGGRNFHRLQKSGNVSARDNPELFVKKSMITDPWKDLVPVRLDGNAFSMDNCAEPSITKSSQEWLPKSISSTKLKATDVKLNIASTGPSLAESLAAAFYDAVSGENDHTDVNATEIS